MPVAAYQAGSRIAARSDAQASTHSCLQVLKVDEIIRTASHSSGKEARLEGLIPSCSRRFLPRPSTPSLTSAIKGDLLADYFMGEWFGARRCSVHRSGYR
jgi:hypothetical protein